MAHASSNPQQVLCDLFVSSGVRAQIDDAWILLPERGLRARAELIELEGGTSGTRMVQLDTTLELWTGRRVVESCVGAGTTHAAAAASAWDSFNRSTFHVLLAAFLYQESDRVVRDAWEVGQSLRAVTYGDVDGRGALAGDDSEAAWFRTLRDSIERSDMTEGTHWVRLYFACKGSNVIGCEVLLDNEPWESVQVAMMGAPWPGEQAFSSVRRFLVVQGGLDVSRSVATMIEMRGQHDDDIARVLERDGASAREAQALLAYVPLAFGRVLMRELPVRVADKALVQERAGGAPDEIELYAEPLFVEATRLADRAMQGALITAEQFTAVAMRSAEVDAVNKALQGGANPEDLVVSTPFITLG